MKTIIFAGGGTAGHVVPNIALIQQLQGNFRCCYVGTGGMEKTLIQKTFGEDVPFLEISAQKLTRNLSLKNLKLPFSLLASIKQCKAILKEQKACLVFAKGGYASFPVVIAAHKLGIKVLVHESDKTLGLSNKMSLPFCHRLITTFEGTSKHKKAVCLKSPIRQEIYTANREKGLSCMGFDGSRQVVTIIGGSLGAQSVNQKMQEILDSLTEKYHVFLVSGKGKQVEFSSPHFAQQEFCSNIFDIFAASSVVLTRGGSNTLCELATMAKPMIVLPLQKASRGEQVHNAEFFRKNGGALVSTQDDTPQQLLEKIDHAFERKFFMEQNLKKCRMDGTEKILKLIKTLVLQCD